MQQTNQQTPAPAVLILQETALKEILQSSLNHLKEEIRELIEQVKDQIKDPKEDNDLLTSNELCELLQTNKTQLWKWTQKGLLNPVRLNDKGKLFYRKSEVMESLKGTRKMRALNMEKTK